MAEINIKTNGSLPETVLTIDGKDVTADSQVVDISLNARAPFVSKYSGETITGNMACSYTVVKDGKLETFAVGTTDTAFSGQIGTKIKEEDSVTMFIGRKIDSVKEDLIDKIIKFSSDNKLSCPDKSTLSGRDINSLYDKAEDLGIQITRPAK